MGSLMEAPAIVAAEPSADIFCHIGRVLTSCLDPEVVIQRVMKIIGKYFSPRNWSLLLKDEDTGRLKFEIVMGVDAGKLEGVSLDPDEGIVGWVCRTGKPVVVQNALQDSRFSARVDRILGFSTRSVVCVPILNGGNRVIGAIELINRFQPPRSETSSGAAAGDSSRPQAAFNTNDMQILSAVGAFTGVAVENALLHQKVKTLAVTDSLTEIYNRHYFNEMLQCEIERADRYQLRVCILMIDVDAFKTINDTFGHLIGDRVLHTIADILKTSVRKSDILARFGGDEFVIILPFGSRSQGLIVAERIKEAVRHYHWQELIPGFAPRLSIGVHASDPRDADSLLLEADRALYRDKRSGRKAPEPL